MLLILRRLDFDPATSDKPSIEYSLTGDGHASRIIDKSHTELSRLLTAVLVPHVNALPDPHQSLSKQVQPPFVTMFFGATCAETYAPHSKSRPLVAHQSAIKVSPPIKWRSLEPICQKCRELFTGSFHLDKFSIASLDQHVP